MDKTEMFLNELHDALFGNGNDPECNYEDMTIGYNEDGDTYYCLYIPMYSDKPRTISMCAYVKGIQGDSDCKAGITINVDDWWETVDYIVEHNEELNERLTIEFEKKARLQRQ